MGSLLFILTNLALASVALGLVRRMRASGPEAWLFGVVLFAGGAEFSALVLGVCGLANPIAALVSTVLLASIEMFWPRGEEATTAQRAEPSSLYDRVAFGLLAGLLALWAVRLTTEGVRFSWDDLSYHGSIIGWWLQTDSISYAPFTYQSYYPLGAELCSFWFSIPIHSMAQANLPILLWLAMIAASALVFAKRIRANPLAVALAIGCLFVSERIQFFESTLTANDLALAAAMMAALATAVHPQSETDRARISRTLISGLAAGMALGTKPSIVPQLFVLGTWWVVSVFRGKVPWKCPVLFLLSSLLLGAFWYARNWIVTGNPLFPASIGPFEGPLTEVAQQQTAIVSFMGEEGFWGKHGLRFLDWPYAAGFLVLLGFIGAPLIALRGIWSKRRNEYLPLWVCALLFLAIYPIQPFSGATNKPLSGFVFLPRYLTFAIAAGLTLAGSWTASSKKNVVGIVTAVFAGIFLSCAVASGLAEVLSALAGAALFALLGAKSYARAAKLPLAITCAVIVALGLFTSYRTQLVRENVYNFTDYWPGWRGRPKTQVGDMWRALDDLPDGARVGSLSYQPSSHVHSLPLMGSRLQHTAVTLHPDGRPRALLHESWRSDPNYWWWEFDQLESAVTPEKFQRNLQQADLDYLIISRWPYNQRKPWPESHVAARMSFSDEQIVYRDAYSMIWKLR